MKKAMHVAVVTIVSLCLVLVGCAPAVTPTPEKIVETVEVPVVKEKVTFRLDWQLNGAQAPFILALDKGFYDEAGLDIEILDGAGSESTLLLVANKSNTFGYVEGANVILGVPQDVPIKSVASILRQNPYGIMSLKATGIEEPKDLEGHGVAVDPASTAYLCLQALESVNNLDADKITVVNIGEELYTSSLLSGRVDSITSYPATDVPELEAQGAEVNVLMYSDWGVPLAAKSIIVHTDTLAEKPDVIRAFIAASLRGWTYAMEHPEEAAAAVVNRNPLLDQAMVLEQFQMILPALESPNAAGAPLGLHIEKDWTATINMFITYGQLESAPALEDCYTDEFLPQE